MPANQEVPVRLDQTGLRDRLARIHDPSDCGFVIDDYLLPAEFSDGTLAHHGQDVVIADDTPNVFGALAVHRPGLPGDVVMLHHTQLMLSATSRCR
jgi:hypothetical protein